MELPRVVGGCRPDGSLREAEGNGEDEDDNLARSAFRTLGTLTLDDEEDDEEDEDDIDDDAGTSPGGGGDCFTS